MEIGSLGRKSFSVEGRKLVGERTGRVDGRASMDMQYSQQEVHQRMGRPRCELKALDPSKGAHVIGPDPGVCRLVVDTWDSEVNKVVLLEPELIDINIPKDGEVTLD